MLEHWGRQWTGACRVSSLSVDLERDLHFSTVSFMGILSVALLPVPLVFLWYGENLRSRSPLATEARNIVFHLRQEQSDDTQTNIVSIPSAKDSPVMITNEKATSQAV
jgi:hypothetical protein